MTIKHFNTLRDLVREADQHGLLHEVPNLSGFSGRKVVGMLQRIASYQNSIGTGPYLEIGIYQGLTLLSVASVLDGAPAFGVDNFCQFNPYHMNRHTFQERMRANNLTNVRIIESDYEDALANFSSQTGEAKIGTCFIDGPHDYRNQLLCLLLLRPHLADMAVIVVDDCNFPHVRQANRDFLLAHPGFRLLYECYTPCHPANMDSRAEQEARAGWWNGINIIVHDPNAVLDRMLPETDGSMQLFENDHVVHGAKYALWAPETLDIIRLLFSFRLIRAWRGVFELFRKVRREKALVGRYPKLNTWSSRLSRGRFNPGVQ